MGRHKKYKAGEVAGALIEYDGMVYVVAKALKVTHTTIYRYIKDYQICRDAKEQSEGLILDLAETNMRKAVKAGEEWAIKFLLKTKGKDRGYTERTELTGQGGDPLQVQVYLPKNPRDN